jgi:Ca-activated chloride channel family protein
MFDFFVGMEFEYPLVLLIILLFVICSIFCKARKSAYYIPHLHIYEKVKLGSNITQEILKWFAIVFTIVALASPIRELQTIHSKSDGIDIVMSLDTSGSMRQIGFDRSNVEKNRWHVVSEIVDDFIAKRTNDNISLVVFGSAVMTASPLSFDKRALSQILSHLDIGVAGDKTALVDSVASSVNMLKESKAKSKVLILLTDGEDTASQIPLKVVQDMAKKYEVKIYTIGIGRFNGFILDALADATGGKSFSASSKDDLAEIYKTIDELEKTEIDQNKIIQKEYYFFYPLFVGIMSLIGFVFLRNRRV